MQLPVSMPLNYSEILSLSLPKYAFPNTLDFMLSLKVLFPPPTPKDAFSLCGCPPCLSQTACILLSSRPLLQAADEVLGLTALQFYLIILIKLPSSFCFSLFLNPFVNETKKPKMGPQYPW